jgi:hypothetical protein
VQLRKGDTLVVLHAAPARKSEPAFLRVGPFALSHPVEHPVQNGAQQALAKAFAAALEKFVRAELMPVTRKA